MSVKLPKIAIVGASSYLGNALINKYAMRENKHNIIVTSRSVTNCQNEGFYPLDLLSPDIRPMKLAQHGYRYAIIFAAVSKLADCEKKPKFTRNINVDGTLELLRQLSSEGVTPVFLSSDVVFGSNTGNYAEYSKTLPLNEYGRQKVEVERQIKDICNGNYLILRLAKVFGLMKGDGTLLDEMAAKLIHKNFLKEAYDQIFCPILIDDLIEIIICLISNESKGIINVCGEKAISRYDLAASLAKTLNIDNKFIQKVSIDDINIGSPRPKNTSMCIDKLKKLINYDISPLDKCIDIVAANWRGC